MQCKWTIEVVADFTDRAKYDIFTKNLTKHAVDINATAQLLGDEQKPKTVFFSDDFIIGHQEIDFMLRARASETPDAAVQVIADAPDEGVSDELIDALRSR